MAESGTVERAGGRVVSWASWGDANGQPLLLIHGTPGSRLARSPDPNLYGRLGAHAVSFDRPGYGRSTVDPERTILSVADDALAVADAQGWSRFSVLGVSGGGPHALALAVKAPDRLAAVGLAVGGAPAELVDPDDLIAVNREGLRRAREEGRESLEEFLAPFAAQAAADPGAMLDTAMADAPPVDRELLTRPDIRAVIVESLTEAFANGPRGWYDDSWALSRPWGFELSEVRVPVRMWYGDADRNVPIGAIRKMASQLQVESLEIIPDAGHLGWLTQEEDVLRTLLDRAS
jgi:pimeloyl-ACP methyl ester carboxylesterase